MVLVAATADVDLGCGLSLTPRLRLLLTFFRSDPSVRPFDEWRLKRALLDYLLDSLSLSIPDEDLSIRKRPDLHKRKRDDPVAVGSLFVRDLSFLRCRSNADACLDSRFAEWKSSFLKTMDGIELNTEGVLFRMSIEVPPAEDYARLKRSWEEFYASRSLANRHGRGSGVKRPDTIVVKGLPSRWFAETRVSSKPSMLVTHTIFSVLGKIRNLNVSVEDVVNKTPGEANGNIISGLHCKIWVQFENYDDFCHALSALCGRSLQKQGSPLKADYEVACDTEGYFRKIEPNLGRAHTQSKVAMQVPRYRKTEISRPQSRVPHFDSDDAHPRRFRE